MKGRVLIIAGSDPSGGAGIQADIKTVTALGGYAASAITALTVQNTLGVSAVHPVAADVVEAQLCAVLDDIGVDAIKIGMIGEVAIVDLLADLLKPLYREVPVVLDPVLVATSGDALASDGVANAILKKLVPFAEIVTPNIDEAAILTGTQITSFGQMEMAGRTLIDAGAGSALVKGGHMSGDVLRDVLVQVGSVQWFENHRIDTTSTHGTGCTLASAIATYLALGVSMDGAVPRAIRYVQTAIQTAPGFGKGHGPLNHAHTVSPLRR